eukprot:TRINITY_DN81095_c0_g1_i1.p1 TRINITY_DN81095_c0_g1~~TRINITY_DN81095_c0_g1_i1.p1  ORF type:complete len:1040 (+),score=179.24 TRINITY_DN81095_c0_g1_i1:63-3122(+)
MGVPTTPGQQQQQQSREPVAVAQQEGTSPYGAAGGLHYCGMPLAPGQNQVEAPGAKACAARGACTQTRRRAHSDHPVYSRRAQCHVRADVYPWATKWRFPADGAVASVNPAVAAAEALARAAAAAAGPAQASGNAFYWNEKPPAASRAPAQAQDSPLRESRESRSSPPVLTRCSEASALPGVPADSYMATKTLLMGRLRSRSPLLVRKPPQQTRQTSQDTSPAYKSPLLQPKQPSSSGGTPRKASGGSTMPEPAPEPSFNAEKNYPRFAERSTTPSRRQLAAERLDSLAEKISAAAAAVQALHNQRYNSPQQRSVRSGSPMQPATPSSGGQRILSGAATPTAQSPGGTPQSMLPRSRPSSQPQTPQSAQRAIYSPGQLAYRQVASRSPSRGEPVVYGSAQPSLPRVEPIVAQQRLYTASPQRRSLSPHGPVGNGAAVRTPQHRSSPSLPRCPAPASVPQRSASPSQVVAPSKVRPFGQGRSGTPPAATPSRRSVASPARRSVVVKVASPLAAAATPAQSSPSSRDVTPPGSQPQSRPSTPPAQYLLPRGAHSSSPSSNPSLPRAAPQTPPVGSRATAASASPAPRRWSSPRGAAQQVATPQQAQYASARNHSAPRTVKASESPSTRSRPQAHASEPQIYTGSRQPSRPSSSDRSTTSRSKEAAPSPTFGNSNVLKTPDSGRRKLPHEEESPQAMSSARGSVRTRVNQLEHLTRILKPQQKDATSRGSQSSFRQLQRQKDAAQQCPRHGEARYEDIKFGEPIGTGSFGAVWKGHYNEQCVAIKQCRVGDRSETEMLMKEISHLQKLRHPRLVSFLGYCNHQPHLLLLMEYMPGGSLYSLLFGPRPKKLGFLAKAKMAGQIAEGLTYLHARGIVHRDLKTMNVVLDDDLSCKICDFGLTITLERSHLTVRHLQGSPRYMAPEQFESAARITEKVDIWQMGCLMLELFCLSIPFSHCTGVQQVATLLLIRKQGPGIPVEADHRARNLIQAALRISASLRPTAAALEEALGFIARTSSEEQVV